MNISTNKPFYPESDISSTYNPSWVGVKRQVVNLQAYKLKYFLQYVSHGSMSQLDSAFTYVNI